MVHQELREQQTFADALYHAMLHLYISQTTFIYGLKCTSPAPCGMQDSFPRFVLLSPDILFGKIPC